MEKQLPAACRRPEISTADCAGTSALRTSARSGEVEASGVVSRSLAAMLRLRDLAPR